MNVNIIISCTLLLFILNSVSGQVVTEQVPELNSIDVEEHRGKQIPLNLFFVNQDSDTVSLAEYFNRGKPVLLTLAYFECPMLCTFVLNGLVQSVSGIDYLPGKDFLMLTISIDPSEDAALAAAKKKMYVNALNLPDAEQGWDFLVSENQNIKSIANAVGFKYFYDEERDEYAHPAVSFILTEKGILSRYLYGINHSNRDLKLALLEASEGKIGSTIDKLILFCYHYDPDTRGYVLFAGNVMRIGGVITVIILGLFLTLMWKKESINKIFRRGN